MFAAEKIHTNLPIADASYKNLVWENLPLPDILLSMYTPAIVSLENKPFLWSYTYNKVEGGRGVEGEGVIGGEVVVGGGRGVGEGGVVEGEG